MEHYNGEYREINNVWVNDSQRGSQHIALAVLVLADAIKTAGLAVAEAIKTPQVDRHNAFDNQ